MSEPIHLDDFQIVPVLELEPGTFATQDRSFPYEEGKDQTNEEQQYWETCLEDSGITGLTPIKTGSWLVGVTSFSDLQLEQYLHVIFDDWGGIDEVLGDLKNKPELHGGFALLSQSGEVLIEPTCCSSLKDLVNWKAAAQNREAYWQELWVGHPWISTKYQSSRLILSDYHEINTEISDRWGVHPQNLEQAIQNAEAELKDFSLRLKIILQKWSLPTDITLLAKQLACIPDNG
ncbi:hypothetical protein [uncultured Gimesia sp.]|uniref:hypothetical protein n=1 Tax=uncultured Gimesia sp. TaxID=1678688 RepID=UPI00262F58D3|nr:hypothetical protein [uncultured Gimesia sp.]